MKYLVIGGSGLIGSNCMRHLQELNTNVMGTHRQFAASGTVYFNAADPRDAMNYDVNAYAPDVIIHTGGLTHVDLCETEPEKSYQDNVAATANVIAIAKKSNSKLVYLSTDYVFDGDKGPYREHDLTSPLNVYGQHKLDAEKLIERDLTNYLIIRVTNVYGDEERNKNFVARIVQDINQAKKLRMRLPWDQYATPVNAYDVARAIVRLAEDDRTGIFHIASTDLCSRVQLFQKILAYYPDANAADVVFAATGDLQQPAKRPLNGGLLTGKFLSHYPGFTFTNIDHYLQSVIARKKIYQD